MTDTANLRTLLAELDANLDTLRHVSHQSKPPDDEQAVRDRLTPLETRLTRLLDTIPMSIQKEGISLPVIQKMLRGRWRGCAPAGEIGTILRQKKYRRVRSWRRGDQEGFAALWYPPQEGGEKW